MVMVLSFLNAFFLLILAVMVGISNMGGLGGGLIAVPYLSFFLSYPTKDAVDIAYIFILFGGIGNYL